MAGVDQLIKQAVGVAAYGGATVLSAGLIFGVLKATMGIRVNEDEELDLDLSEADEHGITVKKLGEGLI